MRTPLNRERSGWRLLRFGLALFLIFFVTDVALVGQTPRKVSSFDIDGLKLKMNLDEVIKNYQVNNIKVNKNAQGIINGYEIKKQQQQKTVLVLSFTGEKRLYRIHFSKIYKEFKRRPKELYMELIKKYGPSWNDNSQNVDQRNKDLYACWGSSCRKYPRTTPILTASIHHSNGMLKLMLSDNRIFNKDWKAYKQKLLDKKTEK